MLHDGRAFKWRKSDGHAAWDEVPSVVDSRRPRIVLCPDAGSPLFAAWQFLFSKGALMHLARDELQLDFHFFCGFNDKTTLSVSDFLEAQVADASPEIPALHPRHEAWLGFSDLMLACLTYRLVCFRHVCSDKLAS